MRQLFLIFWLLGGATVAIAQNTDEALAAQYFGTGEFAKAADLYEQLLKKNPLSVFFYNNLLTCYLKQNEYEKALKICREQQKRMPENMAFRVDEAWIYQLQGNTKQFEKSIKELTESKKFSTYLLETARALERRALNNEALLAYKAERKQMGSAAAYSCETGALNRKTGNRQEAINDYLNCLVNESRDEGMAQAALLDMSTEKSSYDFLKKEIIKRLQTTPDEAVLNDLLIKAMIQQEDFAGALIQVKAYDRRNNFGGRKVMDFATVLIENRRFDLATECMEYVVKLGDASPYFFAARLGLINIGYAALDKMDYKREDLLRMEGVMLDFIKSEGKSVMVIPVYEKLGELYLTKFFDPQKAIAVLNEGLAIPGIRAPQVAGLKLLLGDAFAATDDPWEAQLLYGQVDKDFKEDALGQEAKFRNARLSFYMGEFEWAAAQLDVLKTATSQLIANDAIELALIIQENSGYDSTDDALIYYAKTKQLMAIGHYETAIAKLDSLDRLFPNNSLGDEHLLALAEINIAMRDYKKAIENLQKLIKIYGNDILADKALIMLGKLHEEKLNSPQEALEYYEQMLINYPGSIYTNEARKRARSIRGSGKNLN